MSTPSALPPEDKEMTLIEHLLELRDRLTKAVLAVIVLFLVLFPFANDLYLFIAEPLMRYMPQDGGMIATAVASPFLTPFKLSLVLAIYLAMPVILYQLWAFIAPGLYAHEKRLIGPLLFSSVFLFYAGGLFAYYVVFPLVFQFLTSTAPEGVTIATDISLYLDFVIKMFFAFGVAFEVPVVTVLLILTGVTSPEKLAHARPYVIVGAFVIGMLLTPPDVISQTLLAVPMWLLYELGVWIGALILKGRGEEADAPDPADPPPGNDDGPASEAGRTPLPKGPEGGAPAHEAARSATTDAAAAGALAVSAPAEAGLSFDDTGRPVDASSAPESTSAAPSSSKPTSDEDEDDDFDWDAEFDKIEAEMAALEGRTPDTDLNKDESSAEQTAPAADTEKEKGNKPSEPTP